MEYSTLADLQSAFFSSYNRTERHSSFFLQLYALLLFGVTEMNSSFLRQLTVLKVLFGEREKGKLKVQHQGSYRHSHALGRERRERN